MVRYRLAELMSEKRFRDGQRVTLGMIAEATGITRTTLSNIVNVRGYNTSMEIIEKLCRYFGVEVGEMVSFVDDPRQAPPKSAKKRARK